MFAFPDLKSLSKRGELEKKKEFVPVGSKFFLFRENTIQDGASPECVFIPLNAVLWEK